MAIEDGLLLLLTQGIAAKMPGVNGYGVELPKDLPSPTVQQAFAVRSISSESTYVLEGQDGFTTLDIQIDCHALGQEQGGPGFQGAVALARAIDGVVRGGWAGVLPDSDHTVVQGIFSGSHAVDGYNDANRSFVRTIEYRVQYNQQ